MADKQTNYIFVNFVGGPKFDVTTDRTAIELNRQFTLGRVYRDGTNFIAVQGAYETLFPMNGGINHNDLGGIQGGAADDYYHLTSAEETAATRDATNAVKGLATAAQITKLE
ncbi:unnamed protein product, partial [marine sediment metagenome]